MARSSDSTSPASAAGRRKTSSRSGGLPGVEEVVRILEEDIIFGRLKPRERLVEDVLMARLAVKRHVVRQALAELERLGVVVRERNKGSAVRDFAPQDVEAIYDVRAVLQRHAASLIPFPVAPDVVAELEAIHARHSQAVEAGDLRAVYRLNNEFHAMPWFAACGNPYLVATISEYAWLVHCHLILSYCRSQTVAPGADEHALMIEASRGDRKNADGTSRAAYSGPQKRHIWRRNVRARVAGLVCRIGLKRPSGLQTRHVPAL
ncbi:MAG: GntR family transcriptional regulator [Gammaproteobacteria bacterium]